MLISMCKDSCGSGAEVNEWFDAQVVLPMNC